MLEWEERSKRKQLGGRELNIHLNKYASFNIHNINRKLE